MSVYVDSLVNWGWKLGPSCHMFADSKQELDSMALSIGLKLSWFQPNKNLPHYDLIESKRRLAIRNGAIEVGREKVVEMMNKHRKLVDKKA